MSLGSRVAVTTPNVGLVFSPVAFLNVVRVPTVEYWVWFQALNISARNWRNRCSLPSGILFVMEMS